MNLRPNHVATKSWRQWTRKSWRNKGKANDLIKSEDNDATLKQNGGRKPKKRNQNKLMDRKTSARVSGFSKTRGAGMKNWNNKLRGGGNKTRRNKTNGIKQKGKRHGKKIWNRRKGKVNNGNQRVPKKQQRRIGWKKMQYLLFIRLIRYLLL